MKKSLPITCAASNSIWIYPRAVLPRFRDAPTSMDGNLYAVDAKTGDEKWRFKTKIELDLHQPFKMRSSIREAMMEIYMRCNKTSACDEL
jgi:outer membrane protein assembly factor BamB